MIRRATDAIEGMVWDAAYAVLFPLAAWWVHHGLRSPELAQELRDWPEEVRA